MHPQVASSSFIKYSLQPKKQGIEKKEKKSVMDATHTKLQRSPFRK